MPLATGRTQVTWGSNDHGQLAVPNAALSGVAAITAGSFHSLALRSDGSVVAWGRNHVGQTDVPPEARQGVVAVAAGSRHSMVLLGSGRVVAFGRLLGGWSHGHKVVESVQSTQRAVAVLPHSQG